MSSGLQKKSGAGCGVEEICQVEELACKPEAVFNGLRVQKRKAIKFDFGIWLRGWLCLSLW
jgi:hypothetical protein